MRIGSAAQPFDPSRDIGMVFQQPLLLKWRRVIDNVLLPAEILGLPDAASRERARDLLALVGLQGSEDKYPYELSGGMQQRAAIARALIHDPKLILMDEPFGALDALTREKMNLELLRIWSEASKTIVFVTHGITEAVFLGTRVVVLTAGPARMADNFLVELPHPRTLDMKTHEKFGEYTRRIYRLLGDGVGHDRRTTASSSAPGHNGLILQAYLGKAGLKVLCDRAQGRRRRRARDARGPAPSRASCTTPTRSSSAPSPPCRGTRTSSSNGTARTTSSRSSTSRC